MKVYMLVDGEGITGIVNHEKQVKPGAPGYSEMRKLLMSDLNAAVEGAYEAGASEVIIYDLHYYGRNVILDELYPEAQIIMGKPPKIEPPSGMDKTFDALMMIGFHSMAETKNGLLSHTYTLDMKSLRLNGILMGEIGLEAAIAGTNGVPLVMVSGDSMAMNEARDLIGDFEEACVKYSISTYGALCFPPTKTASIIKQKSIAALKRIKEFKPYIVNPPFIITIEFYEGSSVKRALTIEGISQKGSNMIEIKGNDLATLWETFLYAYGERLKEDS